MTDRAQATLKPVPLWVGWMLFLGGIVGAIPSAIVLWEHLTLLQNPTETFYCDLGGPFSCSTVMMSPESHTFGVPNPFFGLAGFGGIIALGLALLARARFADWLWALIAGGLALITAFCHYLAWTTIFHIESLCINCMIIWTASIVMFCAVLGFVLPTYGGDSAVTRVWSRWWWAIAIAWLALFALVIVLHFGLLF